MHTVWEYTTDIYNVDSTSLGRTACLMQNVTPCSNNFTVTLEPLVHQAIQQGAAVVTEGGAGVGVGAELVPRSLNLQ